MNLLFRRDMESSCSYCQYGVNIGFGEVACKKCGIMSVHGKCSSFRYDPTKREPDFAVELNTSNLDESDFALV